MILFLSRGNPFANTDSKKFIKLTRTAKPNNERQNERYHNLAGMLSLSAEQLMFVSSQQLLASCRFKFSANLSKNSNVFK